MPLPPAVGSLFWEHGDREVSIETEQDLVIGRVLSAGDWESVLWLRREAGDSCIARYLDRTEGRLLTPRQIRLWQVVLDLPEETVVRWLSKEARQLWDRRAG